MLNVNEIIDDPKFNIIIQNARYFLRSHSEVETVLRRGKKVNVWRYTHDSGVYLSLEKWNESCVLSFTRLPDYEIISASEYAKIINVSHVTAKKRMRGDDRFMQVSNKKFLWKHGELPEPFLEKVRERFGTETSTALSLLNKIKHAALTNAISLSIIPRIAEGINVAPQTVQQLIQMGWLGKTRHFDSRFSLVYLPRWFQV